MTGLVMISYLLRDGRHVSFTDPEAVAERVRALARIECRYPTDDEWNAVYGKRRDVGRPSKHRGGRK